MHKTNRSSEEYKETDFEKNVVSAYLMTYYNSCRLISSFKIIEKYKKTSENI